MTGPYPCDHCRGIHFCVFLAPPAMPAIEVTSARLVLECAGCGARTAFRASGPVMADAS